MPGTLPTRRTTILSLLFPVRTFTALLMVILSRLMPFTSTSLSPTSKPASSLDQQKRRNKHTRRNSVSSRFPACWIYSVILCTGAGLCRSLPVQ
uniref:Uncharacterized protein n=1 Tax=Echeneis naucrates TaxID=173247 RepID=A0A665WDB7_ECHNA